MKYKIGDEVIIKGKIIEVDADDDDCPYKIETPTDSFWVNENDLSPAPEFAWWEEVYVSNSSVEDALGWLRDLFVWINPDKWGLKYCCADSNWDYIVKIPKKEQKRTVTLELTEAQLEQIKKQFNIK